MPMISACVKRIKQIENKFVLIREKKATAQLRVEIDMGMGKKDDFLFMFCLVQIEYIYIWLNFQIMQILNDYDLVESVHFFEYDAHIKWCVASIECTNEWMNEWYGRRYTNEYH